MSDEMPEVILANYNNLSWFEEGCENPDEEWARYIKAPANNGGDLSETLREIEEHSDNKGNIPEYVSEAIGELFGSAWNFDFNEDHPHNKNMNDCAELIRTTISQQAAEIEQKDKRIAELEHRLNIADYAFDLCHRYNGNLKSEYFEDAKEALSNTGEK